MNKETFSTPKQANEAGNAMNVMIVSIQKKIVMFSLLIETQILTELVYITHFYYGGPVFFNLVIFKDQINRQLSKLRLTFKKLFL
jgi:hypothetical protein